MPHNSPCRLLHLSECQMVKARPASWFPEQVYYYNEYPVSIMLLFAQLLPHRFHMRGCTPYPACRFFPDSAALHRCRRPAQPGINRKETIFFGSALQLSFRYASKVFALSTVGMFLL